MEVQIDFADIRDAYTDYVRTMRQDEQFFQIWDVIDECIRGKYALEEFVKYLQDRVKEVCAD